MEQAEGIEGEGREREVAAATTLNGEAGGSDGNAFDGVRLFGDGEVDEVVFGVSDFVPWV